MKPRLQLNLFKKILWFFDQKPEGDNYYYLPNNSVALVGSGFIKSHNKSFVWFVTNFYPGSKLYYMDKDGGLSYFDVTTGDTIERLDNTTFVSAESSAMPDLISPPSPSVYKAGSPCLLSPVKTNMNILPGKIFMEMIKLSPSNKGWHCHHFQRRLNYVSWSISEDENFVMILHDRVPVRGQIIQEFCYLFVYLGFQTLRFS